MLTYGGAYGASVYGTQVYGVSVYSVTVRNKTQTGKCSVFSIIGNTQSGKVSVTHRRSQTQAGKVSVKRTDKFVLNCHATIRVINSPTIQYVARIRRSSGRNQYGKIRVQ